jgi:hypothetical protein
MRERSERIGGALLVESPSGGGATATLALPAKLAYAATTPGRRLAFFFLSPKESPQCLSPIRFRSVS